MPTDAPDSIAIEPQPTIANDPVRPMDRERLRVGLVVDRTFERHWLADLIRGLREAQTEVGPVVLFEEGAADCERPKATTTFRLWRGLDRLLFATPADPRRSQLPGFRLDFVSHSMHASPEIRSRIPSAAALETLKRGNLDLVVQIGGQHSAQELSRVANYGSWWIPEPSLERSDMSWFWAMYENRPVFETVLETSIVNGPARILRRCVAALDTLSLSRNRESRQRKISEMLISELTNLRKYKVNYFDTLKDLELAPEEEPRSESIPSNLDVMKFVFRWASDGIARKLRRCLWREQWFVAYRSNVNEVPSSADAMHGFQILKSPNERFYADPFPIDKDGKTYLFFEDYPFDKSKGLISYVEVGESGSCSQPKVALERAYHLSYPFIFEHEGEIYMVPESLEARRIDLYRAVDFPDVWTLEKTLIDNTPATDPTILFHGGKVWLFVSGVRSEACINEELFLFCADSLRGDWTPHPCNPIVSDVRRARPAGRLFVRNGELIRPAQDCSAHYGHSVCFNRIEALSETEYRETPISVLRPEWRTGNLGTHTFNESEKLQVVDGRVLIRRSQRAAGRSSLKQRKQQTAAVVLLQPQAADSVYSQSASQQVG